MSNELELTENEAMTPAEAPIEDGSTVAEGEASSAGVTSEDVAPAKSVIGAPEEGGAKKSSSARKSYLFLGAVASIVFFADVISKMWAEKTLGAMEIHDSIQVIQDSLSFGLAYNKGGAWGLFHDASEAIRKPFFVTVSLGAILFIVNLFSKLKPGQNALRWGLPFVLGGALGNLADRIVRGAVVDFIEYKASWVEGMNSLIHHLVSSWYVTDRWPTFNVADIFICVGVALMAVDMITHRPPQEASPKASEQGSAA